MCAPTGDLAKIATVAALAYASGGSSLFATSTAEAGAAMYTDYAVSSGINWSGMFSTLGNVAKIATPIIGAAGQIYSGILQSNALAAKANVANFQAGVSAEAYQLRKIRRQREAAQAIGKQRALFGLTGVGIEGTPTDVLEQTSARFAEDQYYDLFNTSGKMYTQELTAKNYLLEADAAEKSGLISAGTTLALRGDSFSTGLQGLFGKKPTPKSPYTAIDTGLTSTEGAF